MSEPEPFLPELLELEVFRRSVNRKLWAGMALLAVVALGSLAFAVLAIARPIPVVAFDSQGHPLLFTDTVSPRLKMENIRVEAFAREFLEKWACVDSANVTEDFTASVNLMTPRYRRIVLNDTTELERRKKRSELNMKSRFATYETKIAPYEPEVLDAKIYFVAFGKMRFTPKVAGELEGQEAFKFFFSELALQRVPVAREAIHGLLVDYAYTRLFDTEEDMNVYAMKRSG